ncbi:hypothetical protein L195_g059357, partial [Trifolium pratense]
MLLSVGCSSNIRFQRSLFLLSPELRFYSVLTSRPPWSTSVLNRNTMATMYDTELYGLSTEWFQRKQSRLQR